MIHSVHSSLPSFKPQSFRNGLNVMLAEKSFGASDKQTRNGAGKTSFIELIHFLLGGNADPKSLFRTSALEEYRFGMVFDLGGQSVKVERSGKNHGKVWVSAEDTSRWPIEPSVKGQQLSQEEWKTVLGAEMFHLNRMSTEHGSAPSFRSLFPYFVRRSSANAFLTPEKNNDQQQLGDYQTALSFLLGLDWSIPQGWQHVREREKGLKALANAAGTGVLGKVVGTVADLRTELAVAESGARELREQLSSFHVLPEYESIEKEASALTKDINELADANTLDRRLVLDLSKALKEETPPPVGDLERLYSEAGVIVAQSALKRFEEVKAFHDSVIANRREYLSGEIAAAEARIEKREVKKGGLDSRRSELMSMLQTHGALEHYNKLQSELSKREADVQSLRNRMEAAEQLEGEKTELEIERKGLLQRLRTDYKERRDYVNEAILAFEQTSQELYDKEGAGRLSIADTPNGPQFNITVPNSRSKGIKNMQIFCFDMMLMRLCAKRGIGPGFLIHDSHLFDGVDGRQVAHALEVGAKTAQELGFQYIVTMNSDDLYKETLKSFDLDPYVLPTRLTDAMEDGGLFGMRFE